MTVQKPNRTNVQSANARERVQRKESGDQHILPIDEPVEDPHRPHRISRQDMHKMLPEDAAPDAAKNQERE